MMKKYILNTYLLLAIFLLINIPLHSQSSINVWDDSQGNITDGAIHGRVWANIGGPIKDAFVFVTDEELTTLYGEDVSAGGNNWGDYWIGPLPANKKLVIFAYHPERPFILATEKFSLANNENKQVEMDLSPSHTDPGLITFDNNFSYHGVGGVLHLSGFILRMLILLDQAQNSSDAYALIEKLKSLQNLSNQNTSLGFILDSSGSMDDNDPNDIRKTALINIIKDRLTGNESVHIVDFDSGAHMCNTKVSGWSKQHLINAVKTIDSDGGTDVEAGLDVMRSSLQKHGFSNNTGVMLLTDGKGDYKDGAKWFANNGIKVYTVSFVGDADETLLRNIAQQTGGIYMRANSAEQISNLFNLFYDMLSGSSMFVYNKAQIHQGDVLDYYFPVDNVSGSIYFATNWAGSKVDMKIISPSGKRYTHNGGSGKWNAGNNYITASIPSQEKGDWHVQLIGTKIPSKGEEVSLEVHGKSDLLFDIDMQHNRGIVDFKINSDNEKIINNYSTNVTVQTPSGNQIDITDKMSRNTLTYLPTEGEGSYKFSFLIKGNRIDGSKFQRQLKRFYFAGKHSIHYISPITDVIGNYVYANMGKIVGNAPGIKCYIFRGNINNHKNKIAEGYIINCKHQECTAQIDYYLKKTKAKAGDILKLDESQWRAD